MTKTQARDAIREITGKPKIEVELVPPQAVWEEWKAFLCYAPRRCDVLIQAPYATRALRALIGAVRALCAKEGEAK